LCGSDGVPGNVHAAVAWASFFFSAVSADATEALFEFGCRRLLRDRHFIVFSVAAVMWEGVGGGCSSIDMSTWRRIIDFQVILILNCA
ncbi:hypothetical protein, partial [Frankia sp. AgKG'84/4]